MSFPEKWKCEICGHIGPEEEFVLKEDDPPMWFKGNHRCPVSSCKGEDVFAHRIYRCDGCGKEAPEPAFYPDWCSDAGPANELGPRYGLSPACPNHCKTESVSRIG